MPNVAQLSLGLPALLHTLVTDMTAASRPIRHHRTCQTFAVPTSTNLPAPPIPQCPAHVSPAAPQHASAGGPSSGQRSQAILEPTLLRSEVAGNIGAVPSHVDLRTLNFIQTQKMPPSQY
uniref:Uncharacterized protein n=1 Tax=Branchiostoma floridae TaxID=7739 RepID=C3ZZF8_BRAFL|eukprot:XP_002586056.1 hypothetical protein BRAFLDRAFT_107288 [Branchiostoma floridae]